MKWLTASLLLALIPAATAQDGCHADDACSWVVDIDADGFASLEEGGPYLNGTVSDWYRIEFFNFDDEPHHVRVDGYDLAWTIDAASGLDTEPFQLDKVGAFKLVDDTSGDDAPFNVFGNDAVDVEEGADPSFRDPTDTDGKGAPGLGLPLLLIALAALAIAVRRR